MDESKGAQTWALASHRFAPYLSACGPGAAQTPLQSAGGANPIRDGTAPDSATRSRRGLFKRAQPRSIRDGDSHRDTTQSVGGGGMSSPLRPSEGRPGDVNPTTVVIGFPEPHPDVPLGSGHRYGRFRYRSVDLRYPAGGVT